MLCTDHIIYLIDSVSLFFSCPFASVCHMPSKGVERSCIMERNHKQDSETKRTVFLLIVRSVSLFCLISLCCSDDNQYALLILSELLYCYFFFVPYCISEESIPWL